MNRAGDAPTLFVRGAACGVLAWVVALLVTWLLVVGPSSTGSPADLARILLDVHQPLASDTIEQLPALTWFELPPTVLYSVPPVLVASAGVVAGRLTLATDLWIGTRAGLLVVVGYLPLMAAVALWIDADLTVLGSAVAIAIVCGAVGGIVGVRT